MYGKGNGSMTVSKSSLNKKIAGVPLLPRMPAGSSSGMPGGGSPLAMGKNWIAGAIKHPGAFTKQAKAAGMSTAAYANKVTKPGSKASATTKKRANLSKTLSKIK